MKILLKKISFYGAWVQALNTFKVKLQMPIISSTGQIGIHNANGSSSGNTSNTRLRIDANVNETAKLSVVQGHLNLEQPVLLTTDDLIFP